MHWLVSPFDRIREKDEKKRRIQFRIIHTSFYFHLVEGTWWFSFSFSFFRHIDLAYENKRLENKGKNETQQTRNSITNQKIRIIRNSPSHFRRLFCVYASKNDIKRIQKADERQQSNRNIKRKHQSMPNLNFGSITILCFSLSSSDALESNCISKGFLCGAPFHEYKWMYVKFISSINLEQKRRDFLYYIIYRCMEQTT